MARYTIIGAGNFGSYTARTLFEAGQEVIAIDSDKNKVQAIQPFVSHGIVANAADKNTLEELGFGPEDIVIVSMGKDISASILTTLFLRELQVKKIIVKASSEDHGKALGLVGATEVIFPERDMARKVAASLVSPNILDSLDLSPEHSIIELAPPKEFIGRSLADLQLRSRYNLNIIAIRETIPEALIVNPSAQFVIKDSSVLIAIGRQADIAALPAK